MNDQQSDRYFDLVQFSKELEELCKKYRVHLAADYYFDLLVFCNEDTTVSKVLIGDHV